ncbi:Beta 1,3-galactosyltransferase [Operophtera brumata]|uniref:Beta 1,3-galactosyltransferase n=1 Tax=Operophtera brumata TaxID=104452 RepID=A0A0L7LL58_OPEBR|nr:Beta 1,3-galactosyltransferase [Operophtera brumata]
MPELTSMGNLASAYPEEKVAAFEALVASLDRNYPDDWREWKVYNYSFQELFGSNQIPSAVEVKLRFAIPTVEMARAFDPGTSSLSERGYKAIRSTMLRWPLGRALLYAPHNIMEKIHEPMYNSFVDTVAALKSKLTKRSEASQELKDNLRGRKRSRSVETEFHQPKRFAPTPSSSIEHTEIRSTPAQGSDEHLLATVLSQQMSLFNTMIKMQSEQNENVKRLLHQSPTTSYRAESLNTMQEDLNRSFESHPDSTVSEEENRPSKHSKETKLRAKIAEAQRQLVELQESEDSDNEPVFDFMPTIVLQEPKISKADPTALEHGIKCQKFRDAEWRNVRYAETQKLFQATPAFTALKPNNLLAGVAPEWTSTSILERFDLVLGAITNGLLQQRIIFQNLLDSLPAQMKKKILTSEKPPIRLYNTSVVDERRGTIHHHRSSVGQGVLETRSPTTGRRTPILDPGPSQQLNRSAHECSPTGCRAPKIGGLDGSGWSKQVKNWSDHEIKLLEASWRKSSLKTYRPIWTRWRHWALSKNIPVDNPEPEDLAKYLCYLYMDIKLAPRTIALHKSVVANFSNPLRAEELSSHPTVKRIVKGTFADPTNKVLSWKVEDLLSYLKTYTFTENSLFAVSRHTCILLLLATGRRVHDLTLLSIENGAYEDKGNEVIFWPKFGSKTDNNSYRQSGWLLRKPPEISNKKLDLVFWIKKLILVSSDRRNPRSLQNLLITTRGVAKNASRTVIAGWIRNLFKEAGISASAGSFRSAVSSHNWELKYVPRSNSNELSTSFSPIRYITQRSVEDESSAFGDILQGTFTENYRNLTYKHLMGLRWASTRCSHASFILKVDDDTVFNLERTYTLLLGENLENTMMGYMLNNTKPRRSKQNKWHVTFDEYARSEYPPYLSGWYYTTTPEVARKICDEAVYHMKFWIDDILVSGILTEALNIKLKQLPENFWLEYYELLECCINDMKTLNLHGRYTIRVRRQLEVFVHRAQAAGCTARDVAGAEAGKKTKR